KIKPHIKESKFKYAFLGIIIFISLVFLIKICTKKFVLYSNNYTYIKNERLIFLDNDAFHFLLRSGKNRLLSNKILEAYYEFNLAYSIRPNDKELNRLMIETLSILCVREDKYCDKLDVFLNVD
ncbi:hypothetical protein, partial [uncultured Wocania sp.]|uniref:hypothetical protein n=1 Tax=uncultured Wocania sp. TaxID=2834404 RepID=UPI0030FAEB38